MQTAVAAIDVGGTSVKGALMDPTGALSGLRQVPTSELRQARSLPEAIAGFAEEIVGSGGGDSPYRVEGVGLIVPGLVDSESGVGLSSMILGWRNVDFVSLLSERTGLPVGFGHDVRYAAYAEGIAGAARDSGNYLYLSLGTGVGASFVVGGVSVTGAHGLGGEIAHLVVEPCGPPCRCGKYGCLEMVASAEAIAERYHWLAPDPHQSRKREEVSVEEVAARAEAGEVAARSVWSRAVAALGFAISTYVELLDPDTIVVGGGVSKAGDLLLEPLREEVWRGVSDRPAVPGIVGAHYGALSGLYGAGLLAWDTLKQQIEPRDGEPSGSVAG